MTDINPETVLSEEKRSAEKTSARTVFEYTHTDSTPDLIPLTESQKGVYFECIEDPSSTKYNIAFRFDLPESADAVRFADAVRKTAERHPALFVTFSMNGDGPFMVRHECSCDVPVISGEISPEDFIHPFDLENGPLFRFEIRCTSSGKYFLADIHHLVFDGTSLRIFLSQVADIYNGKQICDESITLFDVSEYERTLRTRKEYLSSDAFFREKLSDSEYDTDIISDVYFPSEESGSGTLLFTEEKLKKDTVSDFSKKKGISECSVFVAAFAYTLSVFRNTHDACFTTVSNGRNHRQICDAVGMFVKTLPLHVAVPERGSVCDFISSVSELYYETVFHDSIPFGDLVREYGVSTDISFVYQSDLFSGIVVDGKECAAELLPLNDCPSKLICMVIKSENGYMIRSLFNKRLYSEGLVRSIFETMFSVVRGFITCDNLEDIDLIPDHQIRLLDSVNSTEFPFDNNKTVSAFLREKTALFPENTAVVYGDRTRSYSELYRISGNLAEYIRNRGIGSDDFVAVLAQRCDLTVIAAWGIARAGACFQPVDPSYPPDRIRFMISDSNPRLVISDRKLAGLLGDTVADILYLDEIESLPETPDFSCSVKPESALALIYTSGTTGNPKGCILENRNIAAFVISHSRNMGFDENTRFASYASFGFDAGIMDIFSIPSSGGALYIIPDEIRLDIQRVEDFYCENDITHGFMTTQVGRMFASRTSCKTLKAFLVGGERLVPFNPSSAFRFINGYGPCETMAYVCCHEVDNNSPVQPIGTPCSNSKLYVTDRFGRRLPVGASGELCISGLQVGRGYLGLPEKTEEVFVQNSFCSMSGYNRMYRTGDIVRFLPDGNLEYIGRHDSQVKIRGFRVELTEIEEVVRRFDGINDAAVVALDGADGSKFIAAYITSDTTVDINSLKSFVSSEKPSYMVPTVIMQIDRIPYTQNHKVDRHALPQPSKKTSDSDEITDKELKRVYDAVAEIIGHDGFGIDDDLFDSGLSSIGMIRLETVLSEEFNVSVRISDIREHSTVRSLYSFVCNGKINTVTEIQTDYPLMSNQTGVVLDSGSDRSGVKYNMPLLVSFDLSVDEYRLRNAVSVAIDAHPFIKTTISFGSGYRLVRHDEDATEVGIIHRNDIPTDNELVRPFELDGGKLYRAEIYDTPDAKYLFLDFHHVIADGESVMILLNDILKAYRGGVPGSETYTGYEAAAEEEKRISEPEYLKSESYYENLLSGCSGSELPDKCPEKNTDILQNIFSMSFGGLSEKILSYCDDNRLSFNAFFNAVFGYTLSEFLHSDDVSYCTVYNGRNDSRLADSFAMLVRTLPVRCIIDSEQRPSAFVTSIQSQLIDTMSNDVVPFSEISSRFGIRPDIFFNYQGDRVSPDSMNGINARVLRVSRAEAKSAFSVELYLDNGIFRAETVYSTDHFCSEFASSFTEALVSAASGFINEDRIGNVSVMSDNELSHFKRMNSRKVPFDNIPAHEFFDKTARLYPDRIAVRTEGSSLTFGNLKSVSDSIATSLICSGVEPGEIVGLVLERSELIPAAELGIMKAGCAFLPMLPSYPDDRISFCLRDAGCRFSVTSSELSSRDAFTSVRVLDISDLLSSDGQAPDVHVDPDQLVYCIYTSGSTGTPKGVMIEHHNLSNFIQTADLCNTVEKGNCVFCMASVSFDMSVTEILFSLCRGKSIYIASESEIHDLDLLRKALLVSGADIMMMTPSFAWSLLSVPELTEVLGQLKAVVLGAEAFQPSLYRRLKSVNPEILVQNGYGPTECTQVCSVKTVSDDENITIGTPFPNTEFHVTDTCGNLLPRYAVGELVISGEGVCRGYVGLPEKNAASFTDRYGSRAYRTGDLVRINRDGEAEFAGRSDGQIKLRGFRIETGEIEQVMQEFDGVIQSKVVVRSNGDDRYLAGYYTASCNVDKESLVSYMKSKLTYYMIPQALMQLDKMPVTANGKLDVRALPEIARTRKSSSRRAPKKSLEEKVLEVFRSVLNTDELYVDDNFFECGGSSLSASKVVMQLKSDGYKIEYQDIFDHQTAGELAGYIETAVIHSSSENGDTDRISSVSDASDADVLRFNTMEYARDVQRDSLGDLVLTGVTGFLGIHILKAFLETEKGRAICLIRKGHFDDVLTRLRTLLVYYFENDFYEILEKRVTLIEGDVTDDSVLELFDGISFDTLINCAASVKHYANDNSIEFVNVHGVENMVKLAESKNARMIQISTTSVPGAHNEETYRVNLRMTEDRLFVIDDMNNQYIRSKYKAEKIMIEAIRNGLKGKIIRVGNLMGRYSDGEFQTNMRTNAFLNGLRGFANIGKCPISHSTDPMSFSPVDCTAKAVILLSGTNDMFTAFNADSRFTFDEMKVIEAMNRCGLPVIPVPDEEYYEEFNRYMSDPEKNSRVSALVTNDRPDVHLVSTDNRFTANVLFRLGFSWPFVDDKYLEKIIESLDTLDFFFMDV